MAEPLAADLIWRHATLANGTRGDIAVRDGHIARIAPHIDAPGAVVEDLCGQLVLPSFVDLHMHLDKAFTAELTCNESGTLQEAIVRFAQVRPRLSRASYVERALRTLRLCAAAGTTAVRSHVDVAVPPEGRVCVSDAAEAPLEVPERVRELIDVQL